MTAKTKKAPAAKSVAVKVSPETAAMMATVQVLAKLKHAKRLQILLALVPGEGKPGALSPDDYSKLHGGTLGSNAYHFRKLAQNGYIRVVKEQRVRGAVKHIYALKAAGEKLIAPLL